MHVACGNSRQWTMQANLSNPFSQMKCNAYLYMIIIIMLGLGSAQPSLICRKRDLSSELHFYFSTSSSQCGIKWDILRVYAIYTFWIYIYFISIYGPNRLHCEKVERAEQREKRNKRNCSSLLLHKFNFFLMNSYL